jgi:hypothetical protein
MKQSVGENGSVTTSDLARSPSRPERGRDDRRRFFQDVSTRTLVAGCALAAFLLRFPGLLWPVRPDEAGFTLVARHWHPQPDRLYGDYFVDRPPPIIALIKASDWIGGPLFIRFVAALGCVLLVVAAARTAYLLGGDRAARWTAVATAAVTTNTMIDAVAAKGEILGIPFVVGSFWLALEALRVLPASRRRALLCAFLAGVLGMTAVGLKQNMASGLAFGGAVLLVSALRKELSWPDFGRLSGAALAGAAVPLGITVAWCLAVGVRLETLWYAVYGFRSDANDVLSMGSQDGPLYRAGQLAVIFVLTGMVLIVGWFLVSLPDAWRRNAPATAGTLLVLLVDGAGVVLGGSFWRPYLIGMVPSVVLCAALVAGAPARRGRVMRVSVALAAASCLLSTVGWVATNTTGVEPPTEIYTGQAIRDVSEPGDTIVVYGGRADIVMTSGLESPYEHLWSLPMRTLDPQLDGLSALLASDKRPTWFVEWVSFSDWDTFGNAHFQTVLEENYELHGDGCGHHIWLRKDVDRAEPRPDCDQSWL